MNTDRYRTRSWPLRAAALLLACALCACLGLRVAAQAGSITVTMRTNPNDPASTPVPGGTLTAYQVAELTETEKTDDAASGLVYTFTEPFAALGQSENENENESSKSGITLPQPQKAESLNDAADLAAQLAAYAQANGVEGTTVTVDENGAATFNDLDNGLYLLVQNTAPSGYQTLRPFLVEVPTMQTAGLLYDLRAYPKLAATPATNEGGNDEDPDVPWWLPLLALVGLPFIGGNNDSTESGSVVQTPAEAEVPAPEEESGAGEGTVTDEPENAMLPQTGQLNWPVPVLALAGLSLVLLGAALRRGGKDEEE